MTSTSMKTNLPVQSQHAKVPVGPIDCGYLHRPLIRCEFQFRHIMHHVSRIQTREIKGFRHTNRQLRTCFHRFSASVPRGSDIFQSLVRQVVSKSNIFQSKVSTKREKLNLRHLPIQSHYRSVHNIFAGSSMEAIVVPLTKIRRHKGVLITAEQEVIIVQVAYTSGTIRLRCTGFVYCYGNRINVLVIIPLLAISQPRRRIKACFPEVVLRIVICIVDAFSRFEVRNDKARRS